MNKLQALKKQKATLVEQSEALNSQLDGIQDRAEAKRISDQINANLDQIRELNTDIEREQQLMEERRGIEGRDLDDDADVRGAMNGNRNLPKVLTPGTDKKFSSMFGTPKANSHFKQAEDFFSIVHQGLHHPGIMAATGMSEGVGVDGGYLVPEQFVAQMLDAALENEIVRPRAQVAPMTSSSRRVGAFDVNDHSANIGGFAAAWADEGDTLSVQKAKLRSLLLKAKKLALYTMASNELIADGMKFEQLLGEMMVKAIAWELDYAFLNGNGVGQPTGVLSDPALISVAKESGQAADTISWNNLKAMFNRLHPASVNNAVWVANANTRVQLLSLVQYVENQAGTENVGGTWIPAMRDDGKGGFTILGIPVIFTEKLPTLGDAGDILLADFSKYIVGLRREMSLAKSGHVGFQTDETGYRGILRADGQGAWSKPVTPKTGETLSWCVTLAERA